MRCVEVRCVAAETVEAVPDLVIPDMQQFAAETIDEILYQAQCDEANKEHEAQVARINTERMEATGPNSFVHLSTGD